MWQDEMRVGLIVKHRKVWMPKGERADWPVQHKYEYFYHYGAVDVVSGDVMFFILPDLKGETVRVFLEVNPAEAMWRYIRQRIANKVYDSLDDIEGYNWIVEALSYDGIN